MTTSTATGDVLADLLRLLPEQPHRQDPYPLYARFREIGAGVVPGRGVAVASRHADVAALLRDPRMSSSPDTPGEPPPPGPPRAFLFLDPPDHTRLRRLVSHAFTPRVVESLRGRVAALTDQLLDVALPAGGGEFDLVGALAHRLPVMVICELLGVPVGDAAQFREWMAAMAAGLDELALTTSHTPGQVAARERAAVAMRAHLAGVVAQRRVEPRDDLVSALLAVRDSGDALSEQELLSTCGLLLLAGNITTVNLITHAVLAVLRDATGFAALRADPSRAERVVEETLRYEPPAHLVTRTALADVEVGGVVVPRGYRVVLLLAAANRDPRQFTDPDRFDPDRTDVRGHLSFAAGAHFCLGAPLARLEAQTVLTRLAARGPGLRLLAEPRYKVDVTMRGPQAVRVACDGTSPV